MYGCVNCRTWCAGKVWDKEEDSEEKEVPSKERTQPEEEEQVKKYE